MMTRISPTAQRDFLLLCFFMAWNTASLSQFSAPFSSVNQGQTREMIREVLDGLNLEGKGDREIAFLIYNWIARTVSYDVERFQGPRNFGNSQEPYHVLTSKLGVCAGYANLFNAMALEAGLNSHIIHGYAVNSRQTGRVIPSNYQTNHAWNMVEWDNSWHFIDATWGSGGLVNNTYFKRNVTTYWFDTPPVNTLFTHYSRDCHLSAIYQEHVPEKQWTWDKFRTLPAISESIRSGLPGPLVLKVIEEQPKGCALLAMPNTRNLMDIGVSPQAIADFILNQDENALDIRALVRCHPGAMGKTVLREFPLGRFLDTGTSYAWRMEGKEGEHYVLTGPSPPSIRFQKTAGLHSLKFTATESGTYYITRVSKGGAGSCILEYEFE